ncbi:hypothetical protein TIFTF001_048512 [Ficus carica]|uniref:Uncharacterized protein n=1 Tax=Ficus carica TaxID=3494 RepID=A0AA87Z6H4_FICCA|nr:hypothetical protein TIFTF001_048510 [Ficus carica]GMN18696.1 hypothetical protein TIFTF001_048512 [Ficus carica]
MAGDFTTFVRRPNYCLKSYGDCGIPFVSFRQYGATNLDSQHGFISNVLQISTREVDCLSVRNYPLEPEAYFAKHSHMKDGIFITVVGDKGANRSDCLTNTKSMCFYNASDDGGSEFRFHAFQD